MTVLGIETSCDETGVGIITLDQTTQHVTLHANSIATSLTMHAVTGGIIPENAAREQVRFMIPTLQDALQEGLSYDLTTAKHPPPIDAIAVTRGPGLIGSLLVGIETAKVLSLLWNKPLIPVNHMVGHIYANFIGEKNIMFPFIALVVSGGHTDLLLFKTHTDYMLLGGTRDDAAGEAFDKIGRLLGLPYPGGPAIEEAAKLTTDDRYHFPKALLHSGDYAFSFSGLKTAVMRAIQHTPPKERKEIATIAYSAQKAIIDVLVTKTINAAKQYNATSVLLSGGVAANTALKQALMKSLQENTPKTALFFPENALCTDNGAMIATAAAFHLDEMPVHTILADPELYFSTP